MTRNDYSRSPFFYVGDKHKLLPQLLPLFPRSFDRYLEPFVGGGSVFINLKCKDVFINDIHSSVIDIHNVLLSYRENPSDFFERVDSILGEYSLTDSSKGYQAPESIKNIFPKTYFAQINKVNYNRLKRNYNASAERDPFELFILMIYGFNRMLRFNSSNEFNLPVGNVDFNSNVVNALIEYFSRTRQREVVTSACGFQDFFEDIRPGKGDFLYLDPPYLITRSEYNKGWSEKDEIGLYSCLNDLDNAGVKFALSNVEVYGDLKNYHLEAWMTRFNVHEIRSNYINFTANGKKAMREVLVTNYD